MELAEDDLLDVVHGLNGIVGILILTIADKPEATTTTGITVLDDNLQSKSAIGGSIMWKMR